MQKQQAMLNEDELKNVSGGATVVEINAKDESTVRCFSCKSLNVKVERAGNYMTVTCKDCGAVDVRTV